MRSASASGDAAAGGLPPGRRAGPGPQRAAGAWRASALRALLACSALCALFWGLSRAPGGAPRWHGQALPPRAAPAFGGMRDTAGRRFHWLAQRGSPVLVFFGYTHCPDVCPLTLVRLSRVLHELGPAGRRVHVVFVTLDPGRDTPRVLRAYLDALFPSAIGLRGDPASTARAAAQWGVRFRRVDAGGAAAGSQDYWLDHTAAVTLVGPHGRLVARYGYAQLQAQGLLRQDLLALLGEPRGAAATR